MELHGTLMDSLKVREAPRIPKLFTGWMVPVTGRHLWTAVPESPGRCGSVCFPESPEALVFIPETRASPKHTCPLCPSGSLQWVRDPPLSVTQPIPDGQLSLSHLGEAQTPIKSIDSVAGTGRKDVSLSNPVSSLAPTITITPFLLSSP